MRGQLPEHKATSDSVLIGSVVEIFSFMSAVIIGGI